MLTSIAPAVGTLLISEPFMLDPNFKRSVILLTEYAETGAVGFVLNHQSDYLLGDILPDTSYSEMPVYIGGPVGLNTLHFIHNRPDKIPNGIQITDSLFWGGDFEVAKKLISEYQLTEDEVKFFTGYSGWSDGQLETELRENTWMVTDRLDMEILFGSDEGNLWKDTVRGLGNRYAHIANFPENPELN
jgi:putative transcriptional regulator